MCVHWGMFAWGVFVCGSCVCMGVLYVWCLYLCGRHVMCVCTQASVLEAGLPVHWEALSRWEQRWVLLQALQALFFSELPPSRGVASSLLWHTEGEHDIHFCQQCRTRLQSLVAQPSNPHGAVLGRAEAALWEAGLVPWAHLCWSSLTICKDCILSGVLRTVSCSGLLGASGTHSRQSLLLWW